MNLKQLVVWLAISFLEPSEAAARQFPANFQFGVASSAYQIEGGWNASGKGEHIWDRLVHTTDMVEGGATGDVACDSYANHKRDVEMLAELGVDFYRFSLSWSRILPTGTTGEISDDGIRYYDDLINELTANNVTPVATLYHWDLPQRLQDLGGWANPRVADLFVDYARVAFAAFGDRVKTWVTFNEPRVFCVEGYGGAYLAPAVNRSGTAEYLCGHTVLLAHGKTYRMYDREFRPEQRGRVALSFNPDWLEPSAGTSQQVGENAMQFELGWFAHPIYSQEGDYPKIIKETIQNKSMAQGFSKSRLPVFTAEEIGYIKGSYDFFGLNHYTTSMVRAVREGDAFNVIPSYSHDRDNIHFKNASWPGSATGWIKVVPWGLTKLLEWIRKSYGNPELIIFENGFSDTGELNDTGRIEYYNLYLNALLDAIEEGSNVTGFTARSLMDGFEWLAGYKERFGLYSVNFEDPLRTRTPKMSAQYYKGVIESHSVDDL